MYPLRRYQCEDRALYKNEELLNKLNYVLTYPVVREDIAHEQRGVGNTTLGLPGVSTFNIREARPLTTWIKEKIVDASEYFMGKRCENLKFSRNWANITYRDSSVACHYHNLKKNFHVAIFYLQLPPGSSDLVFVKDGEEKKEIADFPLEKIQPVNVQEGELLIHKGDCWHGTTVHHSDTPRIVLPFDFLYLVDE